MAEQVWVIDDDPGIRYVLKEYLRSEGLTARIFASGEELTLAWRDHTPDLVLADIRLEGKDGLELMRELRKSRPDLPVIVMTAYSDLDYAVRAFQGGAFEFMSKPFDLEELGRLIRKALNSQPEAAGADAAVDGMVGSCPAFQDLIRVIGRLSGSDIPVLISGETGSGKELVARALHNHSPRAKSPFVAINTAAIPEDLLESELFGHERGAFTGAADQRPGRFEQASGGTLFLDEIGDMPLSLQSRLLRVLAEGEYYRLGGRDLLESNVRIVTATHRDLPALVAQGHFRADLYHRLKVITLRVPPLRERLDDIPALTRHFLRAAGREFRLPPKVPDPALLDYLKTLSWPGNVRELRHLCQSLVALAPAPTIGIDDLPPELRPHQREAPVGGLDWLELMSAELRSRLQHDQAPVFDCLKARFEAEVAQTTVKACAGNQSEAARRLGISRNTLARMLKDEVE